MQSYAEIQAQIAALKKQAEEVRAQELGNAKAQIARIMSEYGLTLADLVPLGKQKPQKTREPVPAKYKNPETGETWSGRGRAPLWLNGKDKEQFLIK